MKASAVSAGAVTTNAGNLNYLTSLKNNAIIDSIQVECGGRVIINQTNHLSQFVNFKMHATSSQDSINKNGPTDMYIPDGIGAYTFTNEAGIGVKNNAINATNNTDKPEPFNAGALTRMQKMCPYKTDITDSAGLDAECDVKQAGTGLTQTTTGDVVLSDHHFVAIIKLKNICDYFDKHPLCRGVAYKLYLRINQGETVFTHSVPAVDTSPFSDIVLGKQTFTPVASSLVQPAMVHLGANTPSSTIAWGSAVTVVENSVTLTSGVSTGPNARLNGVRLYVPSYVASASGHEQLIRQPVLHRPFFDIYQSTISNVNAKSSVNFQLASGISSPKALILVPQVSRSEAVGLDCQASAYDPSPATTSPQVSLSSTQVKIGSQYVLWDRVNYGFTQFIESTSSLFALNGNQTNSLSSGIIDYTRFRHNYRYYVYDLSRYEKSQDKLPQMISLETVNNSNVKLDIYCYLLYERDAEFDLAKGAVQVE